MKMTRKQFIEKLALGVGASILNPIAGSLFDHAMGQTTRRQKLIIAVLGNSMDARYIPNGMTSTSYNYTTNFQWPSLLKEWESYRSNALIVDRMYMPNGGGNHCHPYGALQGFKGDNSDSPGDISIDQKLSQGNLRQGSPIPVINFALRRQVHVNSNGVKQVGQVSDNSTFATAPGKALDHAVLPAELEKRVFGNNPGTVSSTGGTEFRRKILDHIRLDANKLHSRLATEERVKMDEYLSALSDYDRKISAQEQQTCSRPNFSFAGLTQEQNFEMMCEMSAIAMNCGTTNIVAMSMANQISGHGSLFPDFDFWRKDYGDYYPPEHGTGGESISYFDEVGPRIMNFYLGALKKMLNRLSGQPGVLPADTTVLFVSNSGKRHQSELHHGTMNHIPAFILSTNPALKTGGGFVRFEKDDSERVPLGALYVTLSHALGVPLSSFGKYTGGPIAQLLR